MKKIIYTSLLAISLIACSNTNSTVNSNNSQSTDEPKPSVKTLNQAELAATIAKDSVVVIDVRTASEVAEGFIDGADLFIDINGANFQSEIAKLDTNMTYVVYCRSGARSSRAADYMVNNGFANVYNLQGGILSYTGNTVK